MYFIFLLHLGHTNAALLCMFFFVFFNDDSKRSLIRRKHPGLLIRVTQLILCLEDGVDANTFLMRCRLFCDELSIPSPESGRWLVLYKAVLGSDRREDRAKGHLSRIEGNALEKHCCVCIFFFFFWLNVEGRATEVWRKSKVNWIVVWKLVCDRGVDNH